MQITLFAKKQLITFLSRHALCVLFQRNSERSVYFFITARSLNLSIRICSWLIFIMDGLSSAKDHLNLTIFLENLVISSWVGNWCGAFLERADLRRAERINPEKRVQIFKHQEPARHGLMSHLQILAQGVQGKRRSHQVRKRQHHAFEGTHILEIFKVQQITTDYARAVYPAPAPVFRLRLQQEW
jgi:hypothetical protein